MKPSIKEMGDYLFIEIGPWRILLRFGPRPVPEKRKPSGREPRRRK